MIVKAVRLGRVDNNALIDFLKAHEKTQVVSAGCVAGEAHVLHCVEQSLKAFARGTNITKSEEMEFIIRLAAKRQISKALKDCEVKGDHAVFVSWSNKAKEYFDAFKKEFNATEEKFKEASEEKLKAAIEKSATFWLS